MRERGGFRGRKRERITRVAETERNRDKEDGKGKELEREKKNMKKNNRD